MTRVAPSSGSLLACSTSVSVSSVRPGLETRPAWNAPAFVIAAPASRRLETSLSGSWRRNTSIPFSAAQDTNRPTMSPLTGRDPTRNRPRSAIPSGVETRDLIPRIRSQGLSTRRRTVASKTPPPEISRRRRPGRGSRPRAGPRPSAEPRRAAPAKRDGSSYRPACHDLGPGDPSPGLVPARATPRAPPPVAEDRRLRPQAREM